MNLPAVHRVPTVHELGAAALAILARDGRPGPDAAAAAAAVAQDGPSFEVSCAGPDLPAAIEPVIATAEQILRDRPWVGTYRLVVRASRLIVLDLYWKPGQPTRIMGFSRGDWERSLLSIAQA